MSRTVLKNIVQFTNLVIGVPISLPHGLAVNEVAVTPQLGGVNASGFTVSADAINITVTRTADAASGDVNVYAEHWHTIESVLPIPGQLIGLTPFFFANGGTPGAITGVKVDEESVLLGTFTTINFIGAGVTAADAGGGVASVTIPGVGGGPPSGPQPVSYFDDIISAANWSYKLANNSTFASVEWNVNTQQAMCGTAIMNAYQVDGVPDEVQLFYNAKAAIDVFPSPFFKFSEGTFVNSWRVKIASAPPTALEDYLAAIGVGDGMPGFFPNLEGAWFEVNFANGNAHWWAVTRTGAVSTKVDTGVPMVSGNAFNLAVVCEYGVSVKFYIGGVLVATIATNLPEDQNLFVNAYLKPTAGLNAVTMIVDYAGFDWNVVRT